MSSLCNSDAHGLPTCMLPCDLFCWSRKGKWQHLGAFSCSALYFGTGQELRVIKSWKSQQMSGCHVECVGTGHSLSHAKPRCADLPHPPSRCVLHSYINNSSSIYTEFFREVCPCGLCRLCSSAVLLEKENHSFGRSWDGNIPQPCMVWIQPDLGKRMGISWWSHALFSCLSILNTGLD